MWSIISKIRNSFIGYRKFTIAFAMFFVTCGLLIYGYDVSKLGWLAAPLSAFYGANMVEHLPAVFEKMNKFKDKIDKEV